MKKAILFLGIIGLFACLPLWGQTDGRQVGFITQIGQQMPDFKVQMLDGTVLDTKTLKGKVILLDFWGAKCGGCLLELKRFPEEIIRLYGQRRDFFLLPIEAQGHPKTVIEASARRLGLTFPLAYEHGDPIANLFFRREFGLPRTLIINREGNIVYQAFGYDEKEFVRMLEVLKITMNDK